MNPTVEKFGHPATLLSELDHWVVLLPPAQVTFGSLVLAAKSSVASYSKLTNETVAEQAGSKFPDLGWPAPPALGSSVLLSGEQIAMFKHEVAAQFS